jgi:WD40 repeat protein
LGHTASVRCLTALGESQLVSGSEDKTLRVWDLWLSECVGEMKEHKGAVSSCVTLEQRVVSCALDDERVLVWDATQSFACSKQIATPAASLSELAYLGGALVAARGKTAGNEFVLLLIDVDRGTVLHCVKAHTEPMHCLARVSADMVVTGSADKTARLWSARDGTFKLVAELVGHTGVVSAATAVSDALLVTASHDKTLRVWRLPDGKPLHVLEGHVAAVKSVAALDEAHVCSGSDAGTVAVWDVMRGSCVTTLDQHNGPISKVIKLGLSGIVSGSADHTVRTWLF